MAANASGTPQQQDLYAQHAANLEQPLDWASMDMLTPRNNWQAGTGTGMIAKPDGTMVPNPYGLTKEQIYWALSGNPDAIRRLGESLGGYGEGVDPAKKQLFHSVVNYYEAGGGGFNGGGYTAADAARAQQNYEKGLLGKTSTGEQLGPRVTQGLSPEAIASQLADGSIIKGADGNYYYKPDPWYMPGGGGYNSTANPYTSGGGAGGGGGTSGGTTPPPVTGTPSTGTGTPPPATGGSGNGTTPEGGSDQYGDNGRENFPIASSATYSRPTYDPYVAPTRPADINKPFDLFNDEGYQFRLKEGIEGIENSAAARGNLNSGRTLKDLTDFSSGLASQEYGAAFGRYDTSRKFGEGQYQADRSFGRNVYDADRGFDYNSILDERNYNNANRQWDTTFNNANRIDARNFDYGVYTGDRDFNEGQRRWDTSFNYGVATGDRDFEYKTLSDLAKMGLLAVDSSGNLSLKGAQMTSSNNATGAGAGAAGTVANANIANMTVSDFIKWLNSQNVVNGG